MKILLVTESLSATSGWGTYSRQTALELLKRNNQTLVLLAGVDNTFKSGQKKGLGPALSVKDSFLARLMSAWAIWKTIRSFNPDVIHFLVEPYALCMPLIAGFAKTPPWVMNWHGSYSVMPFYKTKTQKTACKMIKQAAAFVVCSNFTRKRALKAILENCGQKGEAEARKKVNMFKLGIPPAGNFQPAKKDNPHILFVGEVKNRKGVLELLKGYSAFCKKTDKKIKLDIAGSIKKESEYTRLLLEFVKQEKLENLITFHGRVSDETLDDLYSKAGAFVMLSKDDGRRFEGFGLVFLEANTRGIPTIGSGGSGCAEAIDDGASGYVVDPEDPEQIADSLKKIICDGQIKPENCRAWADKHNLIQQVDTIESVYRRVL